MRDRQQLRWDQGPADPPDSRATAWSSNRAMVADLVATPNPAFAWTGAERRRELSADGLRHLAESVEKLAQSTESVFLRAGQGLECAMQRFEALTSPMARLVAASDSGALRAVSAGAEGLKHLARRAAESTTLLVGHVCELSAQSRSLESGLHDMNWVVRTMSVVALNARVNVATLGGQTSGLDVFTLAASGLVGEASAVIAEISGMMAATRARMTAAETVSAELMQCLGEPRLRAMANLCDDLDRFGIALERSSQEGGALMSHIHGERAAVATAVMALQIGDATRQRLEHVAHCLRQAADHQERNMSPGPQVLLLAAAHLRDIMSHHLAAVDTARDALNRAHQETGIISRSAMNGGGERQQLATGLQQNLGVLQLAMAQCRSTQQRFLDLADGLSLGLSDLLTLLDDVNEIEDRMDRIGMNAVIACSRLGVQGAALKEISGQLRDLAGSSAQLFGKMKSGLKTMGQTAGLTRADLSGNFGEELLELANVGQTLCSDLAGIEATVRAFEVAVQLEQGQAVREVSEGIKALATHSTAFRALELSAMALDRWSRQSHVAETGLSAALLVAAWQNYTMQQERDLHAAHFGSPVQDIATIEATPAPADQDLADIFF